MEEDILDTFIEVELVDSEKGFRRVQETLTRMGIANNRDHTLTQSCHILQKKGKHYIVHFKEMFALDGRESTFDDGDKQRRNLIAFLLQEWGLVKILKPEMVEDRSGINQLKVIKNSEKDEWELSQKYQMGRPRYRNRDSQEAAA